MRFTRLSRSIFILAALLLAFGIRVWGLEIKSLWYDEGYTVAFAQNSFAGIIAGAAQLELNTPLHYFALKLWMLGAGQSEFAMRLLSVFAGLITVAAAGRCSLRRASQPVAMLFVALSPVCVYLAQETRMYSLLTCLCALAVAQLFRCLRTGKKADWLAWGVLNFAAFATHVLGSIVFGAQVIALLATTQIVIHKTDKPRGYKPGFLKKPGLYPLAYTLVTGLGMLGCLAIIFSVGANYGTTYTTKLNYADTLLRSFATLTVPRLQPQAWEMPAAIIIMCLLLLVLANAHTRLLSSITLISVMSIVAICAITGKYAARYIAIVTPLFLAALGSLVLARAKPVQVVLRGGIAIGLLIGLWQWRTNPIYANDDFRGAAQFIRDHIQEGEAVLLVSGHLSPVFAYYYGDAGWHALPNDPVLNVRNTLDYDSAASTLNNALAGKNGAWLLLWQDQVIDPANITQALLRRQADKLQPVLDTHDFVGLRLQHFHFSQPYAALPAILPQMNSKLEALGQSRGLLGSGCQQFRKPRIGDALMEIFCFWQVEPVNSLPYDTQISLRLLTQAGQPIAQSDQQLAPFGLPATRFDKTITTVYFVPLPQAIQTGQYVLQAIPFTPEGEVSPRASTRVDVLP